MATTEKDFRVKNGLIVADNATIGGTLTIGGATAATESYVTTQINTLIGGAPGTLDTLNELAAAINDDANVYTTLTNSIATKQDTLVSGTSIKTINSTSLLGSGDISVQESLVSGTNIKTINGTSILGSGDITAGGDPAGTGVAMAIALG